jgi:hypothetical protein
MNVSRYSGRIAYLYAFDVAYEMSRAPLEKLCGQSVAQFQVDTNKRAPRQLFFYRPQMVQLPALERMGPHGAMRVERQVKIFPIGAISIMMNVAFDVPGIGELVKYHDLRYADGKSLHDDVIATMEEVRRELGPHLVRAVEKPADEEAYTVFCITSPLDGAAAVEGGEHVTAEGWLEANRRQVAAVLTEEPDLAHLSSQEAEESTSRYLSYYDHDLVVVDWDAALIVDEPRYIDEMVYLMELSNLQLAELEAYDRMLDVVMDRAYRDLAVRGLAKWSGNRTLAELREIRVDLARLSDELQNITKFFGDWHLARIYQAVSGRFHLAEWHKTIDEKLKTLGDLYQLLQADRNNRYMLVLEVLIVLLFVVDLVLIFRGGR